MRRLWEVGLPVVSLVLLITGGLYGLKIAPQENFMGDVYRIIYVHVPSAWMALIAYLVVLGASIAYLWKSSPGADALAESSAEVGVVFNAFLLITGSIWGKPTWGVWWSWDPRLTTAAIMFFAYLGYLAMRHFVEEPEKRATLSAVVGILVSVSLPIVWYSVKWWNSLHQLQSTANTMGEVMFLALCINGLAFLFIYLWFVRMRYGTARARQEVELSEPPPLDDELEGAAQVGSV